MRQECFQGNLLDEDLPSCAVQGVHPSIISLIASIQVSEAVKILIGKNPILVNRLLFADLLDLSIEKIQLSKLEKCPVCGKGDLGKLPFRFWEEICGREGGRTFVYNPENYQNLNLDNVSRNLSESCYDITVSSDMGVTFMGKGVKGSVLISGTCIFEGVIELREAEKIRMNLIS